MATGKFMCTCLLRHFPFLSAERYARLQRSTARLGKGAASSRAGRTHQGMRTAVRDVAWDGKNSCLQVIVILFIDVCLIDDLIVDR